MDRIVAQVRAGGIRCCSPAQFTFSSTANLYLHLNLSLSLSLSDTGLRGRLLPHQRDLQTPAGYWVYATLLSDSRFAVRVWRGGRGRLLFILSRFLTPPPFPPCRLQLHGQLESCLHCASDVVDENVCVVLHYLYSL
jgi:hypothetical protein